MPKDKSLYLICSGGRWCRILSSLPRHCAHYILAINFGATGLFPRFVSQFRLPSGWPQGLRLVAPPCFESGSRTSGIRDPADHGLIISTWLPFFPVILSAIRRHNLLEMQLVQFQQCGEGENDWSFSSWRETSSCGIECSIRKIEFGKPWNSQTCLNWHNWPRCINVKKSFLTDEFKYLKCKKQAPSQ